MTSNEHLFNMFEADILMRFSVLNGDIVSSNSASGSVTYNNIVDILGSTNNNVEGSDIKNRNNVNNDNGVTNVTINIEVEGIRSKKEKAKRFSALRDRFLRNNGVIVERISSYATWKLSGDELEKWVVERVNNARAEKPKQIE